MLQAVQSYVGLLKIINKSYDFKCLLVKHLPQPPNKNWREDFKSSLQAVLFTRDQDLRQIAGGPDFYMFI